MTRIATYGANQLYISRLLEVQQRIQKEQVQVATEKKSQAYSGIAGETNRLINYEAEKTKADSYVQGNALAETKLKAATTALDAIQKTITDFRKRMDTFAQNSNTNQMDIEQVQKFAWQALVDMKSYLGVTVGGQYLFAGGRTSVDPVELPAGSLEDFQKKYDGAVMTVPTTRSSSMVDFTSRNADTGDFTWDPQSGTLTAANPNAFARISAGSRITVNGIGGPKDFTVAAVSDQDATHPKNVLRLSRFTPSVGETSVTLTSSNPPLSMTNANYGALDFAMDAVNGEYIHAATNLSVGALSPGQVFNVTNSVDSDGDGKGDNDGSYTVKSVDTVTGRIYVDSVKQSFLTPSTGENGVTFRYTDATGAVKTMTSAVYGAIDFDVDPVTGTEQIINGGGLLDPANMTPGSTFTITGSVDANGDGKGDNDGTYTVKSNDGTNLVIEKAKATVSLESWYKGDTITLEHRVDDNRTIDLGIYASDPAFEKAMRAMELIAQGAYGTAGGLENNLQRVNQARYLLNDSIEYQGGGHPPFGAEARSDINSLGARIGTNLSQIKSTNDKHKNFIGFLDSRIIGIENVDKTETITTLLDDQRALEAGYQTLASVRNLSLLNYMK